MIFLSVLLKVLGLITFSLGVSSYTNSSYTEFYSNATSNGNPKNLPGTELELYHLSSAGIYLGISVGYLVLYAFIYELCESRLNRIMVRNYLNSLYLIRIYHFTGIKSTASFYCVYLGHLHSHDGCTVPFCWRMCLIL
jgi:hypothetical protein